MRTPEQMRAIQTRGSNLLVSAAAGAGKTTVLVDRILSMIKNERLQLSQMLVVTFTRDAANVMRERICRALEREAACAGEEDAAFYAQQLDLLPNADICTLHTFCQKFLRRHFAAAGIPANFRVADQQRMYALQDAAVRELLEEQYQLGLSDFMLLTRAFSRTTGDDALIAMLLRIYEFSRCQSDPRAYLHGVLKLYDTWTPSKVEHLWNRHVMQAFVASYEEALASLRQLLLNAQKEGACECSEVLQKDAQVIEARLAMLHTDGMLHADRLEGFARWKSARNLDEAEKRVRQQLKSGRDEIRKAVQQKDKKWFELFGESMQQAMEQTAVLVREIVRLVELLDARLYEKMIQEGVLDFSALEHCTIDALVSGAAQQARAQYRAIFFDEYQDANRVQERIVQLIAGADNLFFVGDVKQSIYRFRSADPQLFMDKYMRWAQGKDGQRIDLNQNFRSMQGVLDAVNSVFCNIMHQGPYSVGYDEAAALRPGTAAQCGGSRVQLHVLEPLTQQAQEQQDTLELLRADQMEARYVAGMVRKMLESGTLIDRDSGQSRPICKKDIAILLRSTKNRAETFSYALDREGVDNVAQMSSRHFDTVEVRALLDLLSVLDNPFDDIALLGALRSPLFLFELDDLARIRLCAPHAPLIDALVAYAAEDDANDPACAARCRDALEKMRIWRLLARVTPLAQLLERIMADTGYEDLLAASAIGMQKLANIRLLLARVDQWQQDSMGGISNFLMYVRRVRSGEDCEEADQSAQDDVVRIMSIHKSKGLEYPIVIVPMLGKRFHRDNAAQLYADHDLGLALRYTDPVTRKSVDTVASFATAQCIAMQEEQEEMRILYVAMTRACDRLILTGMAQKGMQPQSFTAPVHARCMLDWIFPAAMQAHDRDGCWELIWAQPQLQQQVQRISDGILPQQHLLREDAAGKLYERIDVAFSWQYPFLQDTLTPSKTTVSALKLYGQDDDAQQQDAMQITLPLPKRPSQYTPGEGARRGTATHLAVQHLDFVSARQNHDVGLQLDQMVAQAYLTTEDRNRIREEDLDILCRSALGARLAQAQAQGLLHRETPFTFAPEGNANATLVQGAIDAWFEQDDELILIDFKTDSAADARTLLVHYARQLQWYTRALEALCARRVDQTLLYSFSCGQWVSLQELENAKNVAK